MKRSRGNQLSTLTDFDVHEVSLVDLAANKRRFLIAKRSEAVADNSDSQNDGTQGDPQPPGQSGDDGGAGTHTSTGAGSTNEILAALKDMQGAIADLRAKHDAKEETTSATRGSEDATQITKSLQQRLTRLEKHFGLPNSTPVEPARSSSAHVWPFDLNSPDIADTQGSGR